MRGAFFPSTAQEYTPETAASPVCPVRVQDRSKPAVTGEQLRRVLGKIEKLFVRFDRYLGCVRFPEIGFPLRSGAFAVGGLALIPAEEMPQRHYFFPNGHGVIVERTGNGRFSVLPVAFGINGRLETLPHESWELIAEAGFPNPRQLDSLEAAEAAKLVWAVSALNLYRRDEPSDKEFKPESGIRWHRWNPRALLS